MNSIPEEQNLEVISLIEKLLQVPERSPRAVADGRAKFLAEAQLLQPAISRTPERRHIEWKTIFSRKVQPIMVTLSTLLMIFALLFGGAGATVYAAQGSLPDQQLYGVKLVSEDVRIGLAPNNQARQDLLMNFADMRLEEALQLAAKGRAVPVAVWERMEGQFDSALHAAAGPDDEQMRRQLLQLQVRIVIDLAKLAPLMSDSRYRDDVTKVQVFLLIDLKLISMGMTDPSAFRQYMRLDRYPHGWQISTPVGSVTPEPTVWPSVTPALGSPTQMPNNSRQDDRRHNNHHDGCCQNQGGGWWHH